MTRIAVLAALLLATGCASKFAPTPRMTSMQASLGKEEAAKIVAAALAPSRAAEGLCKAPFWYDDPRPTATPEAFTLQAYRKGDEIGRTKEKDYKGNEQTVIQYRKDRYAETRKFADVGKIRLSRSPAGICATPAPRGTAAITLHMGRVEVPIVFAVDDVDRVLAALTVLAPQASIVEGAGL